MNNLFYEILHTVLVGAISKGDERAMIGLTKAIDPQLKKGRRKSRDCRDDGVTPSK